MFEKRLAEKLHKPKRKETVAEILRGGVRQLERFRHPRILQVVHAIEECSETIAFATEPVMASLANILAYHEHQGTGAGPPETGASAHAQPQHPIPRPPHACDYSFLGIELKYGFLQVSPPPYPLLLQHLTLQYSRVSTARQFPETPLILLIF